MFQIYNGFSMTDRERGHELRYSKQGMLPST